MKKYLFVLLGASIWMMGVSFADDASGSYDDIMPNWETSKSTTKVDTGTDKNTKINNKNSSQKKKGLTIPNMSSYDYAIRNNRIVKTIETGQGIKHGLRTIIKPGSSIITIANYIFGAIALIWLSILGGKFIFSGGEEEKLSKYKRQFGWIILGLLVISVAEYLAFNILDPVTTGSLDNEEGINNFVEIVRQIIVFLKYLVGGVALLAGIRSGFALMISGGEDETIQKEKEFVKIFLFAIALIILAESLERWIDLSFGGAGIQAESLVVEVVGILNFILTFIAGAALFMFVLSSLYYVISFGDEDTAGRAKKMIISSLIGMVLAYSAYTIVSFLV